MRRRGAAWQRRASSRLRAAPRCKAPLAEGAGSGGDSRGCTSPVKVFVLSVKGGLIDFGVGCFNVCSAFT
eukprot:2233542-Pleurochrysis_carterae.AAC.1